MEPILAKWEAFAATCSPASASMTSSELRDDAKQILEAVAADLRTSQSPEEQADKSMGLAAATFGAPETAAQTHAILRAKSGYDINQLASEYRAPGWNRREICCLARLVTTCAALYKRSG